MIIFNASVWHGHTANTTAKARRSIQGYFVRCSIPRQAQVGSEFEPRDKQPFRKSILPTENRWPHRGYPFKAMAGSM